MVKERLAIPLAISLPFGLWEAGAPFGLYGQRGEGEAHLRPLLAIPKGGREPTWP